MKVLIVGAGMQGQVITWNLGRCPAVTEIAVADYDEALRTSEARKSAPPEPARAGVAPAAAVMVTTGMAIGGDPATVALR